MLPFPLRRGEGKFTRTIAGKREEEASRRRVSASYRREGGKVFSTSRQRFTGGRKKARGLQFSGEKRKGGDGDAIIPPGKGGVEHSSTCINVRKGREGESRNPQRMACPTRRGKGGRYSLIFLGKGKVIHHRPFAGGAKEGGGEAPTDI